MAFLRNPKNLYISLRSPHRSSAFYALQLLVTMMITFSVYNIIISRYNNIIYNMLLRFYDIRIRKYGFAYNIGGQHYVYI